MFYLIERSEILEIAPKHMGKRLDDAIIRHLRAKVEGKCSAKYGFTLIVTSIQTVGKGRIHEETGAAHFPITYMALMFRPFRNEVLPARVVNVNQSGFFASIGPMDVFVSSVLMPDDMVYEPTKEGQPAFYSKEHDARIEVGSLVRIKVKGLRLTATEIITLGSIKDDFLGPTD